MKKIFVLFFLLCLISAFAVDIKPVNTGEAAPELASPVWLDGKIHRIKDFRDKKFVVLCFWDLDQSGIAALPGMISAYKKCDPEITAFLGIGSGTAEMLTKFPGVTKLPFPVCADHKRFAAAAYLRKEERLPIAVVIDRNGVVNWRGRIEVVPALIQQMAAGKFDLSERIRMEKFAGDVGAAIRAGDFDKACRYVNTEWKRNPDSLDLLNMQLSLLKRKPDGAAAAAALFREAHQLLPKNPALYELELKFIKRNRRNDLRKDFFRRLCADMSGNPMLLLKLAIIEGTDSTEDFQVVYVRDLLHTGWNNGKFKDDDEKGKYAIEYAKIVHAFGRTDLALRLAEKAEKLFSGDKDRKGARGAAEYYRKLLEAAPTFVLE